MSETLSSTGADAPALSAAEMTAVRFAGGTFIEEIDVDAWKAAFGGFSPNRRVNQDLRRLLVELPQPDGDGHFVAAEIWIADRTQTLGDLRSLVRKVAVHEIAEIRNDDVLRAKTLRYLHERGCSYTTVSGEPNGFLATWRGSSLKLDRGTDTLRVRVNPVVADAYEKCGPAFGEHHGGDNWAVGFPVQPTGGGPVKTARYRLTGITSLRDAEGFIRILDLAGQVTAHGSAKAEAEGEAVVIEIERLTLGKSDE